MTKLESTIANPAGVVSFGGLGDEYRPFSQLGLYAFFRRAREEEPVFYCREINYWVVTQWIDIMAILRDHKTFSAANTLSPIFPIDAGALKIIEESGYSAEPVQSNCLPPKHTRIRRNVQKILNPAYFESLRPKVRAIVSRNCERIAAEDRINLADFAYDVPALVMFSILNLPDAQLKNVQLWARDRHLFSLGALPPERQRAAARSLAEYWNFCVSLAESRRHDRGEDYVSRLWHLHDSDPDALTENEIINLVFAILLSGHETTANMALNMFHTLLESPARWRALCDDASLIPGAVEECLRWETSAVAWRRQTTRPVQLCGQHLPAGANVLLALASGNRDERTFEEGETFKIDRKLTHTHLSFGHGIHKCVGAELARLELRIILEECTRRFPQMALDTDLPIDFVPLLTFRGPTQLWVRTRGAGHR